MLAAAPTQFGGGPGCRIGNDGCGTVFKLAPDGQERILFRFQRNEGAFSDPRLVTDADGFLYGTTMEGGIGNPGNGIVFKIAK